MNQYDKEALRDVGWVMGGGIAGAEVVALILWLARVPDDNSYGMTLLYTAVGAVSAALGMLIGGVLANYRYYRK